MQWLYVKGGQKHGPISEAQAAELVERGEIGPDDLVWHPGLPNWIKASEVVGMFIPPPPPDAPLETDTRGAARPTVESDLRIPSPEPGPAFSASDLRPEQHGNWLTRHWRGDLSLGISYWVNGSLLTLGTLAAVALVFERVVPNVAEAPKTFSFLIILMWPLVAILAVWQLVGIWRSSTKHVAKRGSRLWANLAKVSVILGALSTVVNFARTAAPQICEFSKILVGRDPFGTYQLRVLRDASELEISGALVFGLTNDVSKILEAHPTIKIIHLNSTGGRVAEARKLRDLIESRRMATYTASGCSSACVIPFLAGSKRLIAPKAMLGFHQYAFPGLRNADFSSEYAKDRSYFVSRGVRADFAAKAFETPSAEMWTPSHEELLAAGVITGHPMSNDVAISGLGLVKDESLEAGFLEVPIYRALKAYEPSAYSQIVAVARETVQRGGSWAELRARTHPILVPVYLKRLPHAGDAEILSAVRLLLDEMAALYKRDPKLCYLFIHPEAGRSMDLAQYLPGDLASRELAVMAEVISSSATTPGRPMGEAEGTTVSKEVFGVLVQRFGKKASVIALDRVPEADQATYCQVAYAMYEEILAKPPAQAASALRYLFAQESK